VSVAIGDEPSDIHLARAFYAGAQATEVTDTAERERGWRLLVSRHSNLAGSPMPDFAAAALMRADCRHVSVVDYTRGLGHSDRLELGDAGGGL
jgi:hypothetical protein